MDINWKYYLIIFIIFILVIISSICIFKGKKNKNNTYYDEQTYNYNYTQKNDNGLYPIKYRKYNTVEDVYLEYRFGDNDAPNYLTWRYGGTDSLGNSIYNLIMLPYKNEQNKFTAHFEDHIYLKPFYEKYNLYHNGIRNELDNIVFLTSEYNSNKEQYLEIVKFDKNEDGDDLYSIKASIWSKKGPNAYLHIDDKNKLYFEKEDILDNLALFYLR